MIEAGRWGNTVADAACALVCHQADDAKRLDDVTHLLDRLLLADLPTVVPHLMQRLQALAALDSDVTHLMAALPSLVNILRYRDVRQTDASAVSHVVDGMVTRVCIGLSGACASLNDEAAQAMVEAIASTHSSIKRLRQPAQGEAWANTLVQLCNRETLHGLVAGYGCRLLLDEGSFSSTEAARRLNLALSLSVEPTHAAAWVEGFLRGSGLLLLHDDSIWQVLDTWLSELPDQSFTVLLPLLRRTFSNFSMPERRQMGQRVLLSRQPLKPDNATQTLEIDRANQSLTVITKLLGLPS